MGTISIVLCRRLWGLEVDGRSRTWTQALSFKNSPEEVSADLWIACSRNWAVRGRAGTVKGAVGEGTGSASRKWGWRKECGRWPLGSRLYVFTGHSDWEAPCFLKVWSLKLAKLRGTKLQKDQKESFCIFPVSTGGGKNEEENTIGKKRNKSNFW